jgi:hypothetical protein
VKLHWLERKHEEERREGSQPMEINSDQALILIRPRTHMFYKATRKLSVGPIGKLDIRDVREICITSHREWNSRI